MIPLCEKIALCQVITGAAICIFNHNKIASGSADLRMDAGRGGM
jgi:hypothetical protein